MKISRAPLGLIFAAVLALVATDVMAQRPGGGGGRGGRGGGPGGGGRGFGGGGFGGGFMRGGGGGLTGLLRNESVRDEIELMPDQEDAIRKIQEGMPRPERPSFDFRDRSEENRAKMEEWMEKMRKQRQEAEAKVKEQLEEVLLPEQLERLTEIYIQSQGIAALQSADVIKELKISDSQVTEMKEVVEKSGQEMRAKMQEVFQGGFQEGGREKIREMMTNAQKEIEEKVLGTLTSEQKKGFEELKGEPFEGLQQGRGFGGGRGGPGGDRGGDRGGRGGRGGDRGGDRGGRGGGRPEIDDI